MGRRVSPTEKVFNPVEAALAQSVLKPELETTAATEPIESRPSPAPPALKVVQDNDAQQGQKPTEQGAKKDDSTKLTRARRFLLTEDEDDALEKLASAMKDRLGNQSKLTVSNLLRAATMLLLQSRDELLKQSSRMALKRPSNNDAAGLVSFEHNIARLVDRAIRNSRLEE
jgi:hypothetical protein